MGWKLRLPFSSCLRTMYSMTASTSGSHGTAATNMVKTTLTTRKPLNM